MSRSRKHTPISGYTTAKSCADYKRERAGKERARMRTALHRVREMGEVADEPDIQLAPWDEWDCPRDGKMYWPERPGWSNWNPADWAKRRREMMRK